MKRILKYRYLILALWLIVTLVCAIFQPNLKQILNQKGEVTISEDAPSRQAAKLLEELSTAKGDSLILVFNDGSKLTDDKLNDIQAGIDKLSSKKEELHITSITDPFGTPEAKDQLVSEDNTTLLVQVNYEKGTRDYQTIINDFSSAIEDVKVKHYITGEAAVTNDYLNSVGKGVDRSAVITIAFILIVLILMFRSVVTPFVTLLSVSVSYLCTMGIIGVLIHLFDFPITSLTQMFIIIVLFGIGTDYHILLFNRYKEELGNGLSVPEAIVASYRTAGKTILFSGLTVFMGFASLSFVQFPIYRSANAVAIGIAVLLLEMVTLTPLLMRILAGKLFWPSRKSSGHKDSLWEKVTSASVRNPVISLIIVAVILSPIVIFNKAQLSFDSLKDLSSHNMSVQGFNLVKEKFSAGKAMPTTIVIQSGKAMDNNESLAALDNLTQALKGMKGIKQVLGPTQPKGEIIKNFYTDEQLKTVTDGLSTADSGVGQIKGGLDKIQESLTAPDFSQAVQLSEGTGQLLAGMGAISKGLTQIDSGISQGAAGADQLATGIARLKSGVEGLNQGLVTISGKLDQINQGYQELGKGYKAIPASIDQLQQLAVMMQGTVAKLDKKLPSDSDVAALKTMVDSLLASLDKLKTGMEAANTNFAALTGGLTQLNSGVAALVDTTGPNSSLVTGINQLEQGATALAKGLRQGSAGQKAVIASMQQLQAGQEKVKAGQDTLISGLDKLQGGMAQLKDGVGAGSSGLQSVSNGLEKSVAFLTQLTSVKSFYIPKEALQQQDVVKMLDAYMSEDRKTAKMTVILDYEPYSDDAIKLIDKINALIGNELDGTIIDDAKFGVAGVTAHSNDLSKMAIHDITFTEIIVLAAIFILLVLILKSFWIPIYVIGCLVASYYVSLSAVDFLSKQLFTSAQNGLSWNVPFFAFIAITSLGVDYSIFLLRRFKEYPELTVKDAIILAAKNTGGVVISAAVILSGTFATLYPSNLIVLMELAIGVVIGLILLSFVLLPVVVPALISLTEKIMFTES